MRLDDRVTLVSRYFHHRSRGPKVSKSLNHLSGVGSRYLLVKIFVLVNVLPVKFSPIIPHVNLNDGAYIANEYKKIKRFACVHISVRQTDANGRTGTNNSKHWLPYSEASEKAANRENVRGLRGHCPRPPRALSAARRFTEYNFRWYKTAIWFRL